jgi:hypothetical protein
MINLMPYELKKQTSAARVNFILFRLVIILGFAIAFLALACTLTYFLLISAKENAQRQQLKIDASTSPVQKQADAFRSNLIISKGILDRQVSYTKILTELGRLMPTGTALDAFAVNDTTFGTTIKLKVLSTSSENETKLKQNFNGSRIFTSYKFDSTSSNQDNTKYPFVINISVIVNKDTAL